MGDCNTDIWNIKSSVNISDNDTVKINDIYREICYPPKTLSDDNLTNIIIQENYNLLYE